MRPSGVRKRLNNRGQATLEFLLTSILVLTTIFAAVQLSVFVYTYSVLAEGAKQGVRYAIVHGSTSTVNTTTDVETAIKRYVDYPGMTINVSYPDNSGSNAPSNRVVVTLSYPFSLFSLGWALPTVRASARGRIFH